MRQAIEEGKPIRGAIEDAVQEAQVAPKKIGEWFKANGDGLDDLQKLADSLKDNPEKLKELLENPSKLADAPEVAAAGVENPAALAVFINTNPEIIAEIAVA